MDDKHKKQVRQHNKGKMKSFRNKDKKFNALRKQKEFFSKIY